MPADIFPYCVVHSKFQDTPTKILIVASQQHPTALSTSPLLTFCVRAIDDLQRLEPPAPADGFERIVIDQIVVFDADAMSDERLSTCAEVDDVLARGVRRKHLDAPLRRGDGGG